MSEQDAPGWDVNYRERGYRDMLQELEKNHHRRAKKASKDYVSRYAIFVIERMPDSQAVNSDRNTLLLTDEDPHNWAVLVRIRKDTTWRVVIVPRDYPEPTFQGLPVMPLVTRRVMVNRPAVLDFYLQMVSELAHPMRPTHNSLLEFIYAMDPDPAFIKQLYTALGNEFFPMGEQVGPQYTILQATHPNQFSEVATMMERFDPRANRDGRQQDWSSIMEGKQQLFVAYSTEAMKEASAENTGYPSIMGYLAASSLVSDVPRLISLVVVPDDRRRGLATLLLLRYFAQTSTDKLLAAVPKVIENAGYRQDAYHICSLLQKLGAKMDRESNAAWRFVLQNPHRK